MLTQRYSSVNSGTAHKLEQSARVLSAALLNFVTLCKNTSATIEARPIRNLAAGCKVLSDTVQPALANAVHACTLNADNFPSLVRLLGASLQALQPGTQLAIKAREVLPLMATYHGGLAVELTSATLDLSKALLRVRETVRYAIMECIDGQDDREIVEVLSSALVSSGGFQDAAWVRGLGTQRQTRLAALPAPPSTNTARQYGMKSMTDSLHEDVKLRPVQMIDLEGTNSPMSPRSDATLSWTFGGGPRSPDRDGAWTEMHEALRNYGRQCTSEWSTKQSALVVARPQPPLLALPSNVGTYRGRYGTADWNTQQSSTSANQRQLATASSRTSTGSLRGIQNNTEWNVQQSPTYPSQSRPHMMLAHDTGTVRDLKNANYTSTQRSQTLPYQTQQPAPLIDSPRSTQSNFEWNMQLSPSSVTSPLQQRTIGTVRDRHNYDRPPPVLINSTDTGRTQRYQHSVQYSGSRNTTAPRESVVSVRTPARQHTTANTTSNYMNHNSMTVHNSGGHKAIRWSLTDEDAEAIDQLQSPSSSTTVCDSALRKLEKLKGLLYSTESLANTDRKQYTQSVNIIYHNCKVLAKGMSDISEYAKSRDTEGFTQAIQLFTSAVAKLIANTTQVSGSHSRMPVASEAIVESACSIVRAARVMLLEPGEPQAYRKYSVYTSALSDAIKTLLYCLRQT